jgi:hypothetical protein
MTILSACIFGSVKNRLAERLARQQSRNRLAFRERAEVTANSL